MPKDAKMGLILGIGILIIIAVLFFRHRNGSDKNPKPAVFNKTQKSQNPGNQVSLPENGEKVSGGYRHVVQDGETLFSIAQKYYRDKSKFVRIYDANRGRLDNFSNLAPGTELFIPELQDRGQPHMRLRY